MTEMILVLCAGLLLAIVVYGWWETRHAVRSSSRNEARFEATSSFWDDGPLGWWGRIGYGCLIAMALLLRVGDACRGVWRSGREACRFIRYIGHVGGRIG